MSCESLAKTEPGVKTSNWLLLYNLDFLRSSQFSEAAHNMRELVQQGS